MALPLFVLVQPAIYTSVSTGVHCQMLSSNRVALLCSKCMKPERAVRCGCVQLPNQLWLVCYNRQRVRLAVLMFKPYSHVCIGMCALAVLLCTPIR
jgi:hypothetical protein